MQPALKMKVSLLTSGGNGGEPIEIGTPGYRRAEVEAEATADGLHLSCVFGPFDHETPLVTHTALYMGGARVSLAAVQPKPRRLSVGDTFKLDVTLLNAAQPAAG